jgi:hypothetical protein
MRAVEGGWCGGVLIRSRRDGDHIPGEITYGILGLDFTILMVPTTLQNTHDDSIFY